MEPTTYRHRIELLRSGFQLPERRLFFGRARLYFDRIELSGWQLNARYVETIPLDAVTTIEWRDAGKRTTGVLHLDDGRRIELNLDQGTRWREALDVRLSWQPEGQRSYAADRPAQSMKDVIAFSTSMS